MLAFVPTYWVVLYFGLYVLTNLDRPPRILYVSDLLNSGDDTVALFVLRWIAWLLYVLSSSVVLRAAGASAPWILAWRVSVVLCVVSGFQPRIFDLSTPEWLRWAHYVCSGLVLFVAVGVVHSIGWRGAAAAWFLFSLVYCVLFLLRDEFDTPNEIFAVCESVAFWALHVAWAVQGWRLLRRVPK